MFRPGEFVDDPKQLLVSLFLHVFIELARHLRRRCVATLRIFEDVGGVEPDFARERKGLLEVIFGFAGEPDNDIGGEGDAGVRGTQFFHQTQVTLARVGAVAQALDNLMRTGLVEEIAGEGYRYQQRSALLDAVSERLELLYRQKPVRVIRAILDAPNEKLRILADAFRLSEKGK